MLKFKNENKYFKPRKVVLPQAFHSPIFTHRLWPGNRKKQVLTQNFHLLQILSLKHWYKREGQGGVHPLKLLTFKMSLPHKGTCCYEKSWPSKLVSSPCYHGDHILLNSCPLYGHLFCLADQRKQTQKTFQSLWSLRLSRTQNVSSSKGTTG